MRRNHPVDVTLTQTGYWEEGPCVISSEVGADTHYSTDIIITPPPRRQEGLQRSLGGESLTFNRGGKGEEIEGHKSFPALFSSVPPVVIHLSIICPPPPICGASSPCRDGSSLPLLLCPAVWSPPTGSSGRQTAQRRWQEYQTHGWAGWSGWGFPGHRAPGKEWVDCLPVGNGPGIWGPKTPYRSLWEGTRCKFVMNYRFNFTTWYFYMVDRKSVV